MTSRATCIQILPHFHFLLSSTAMTPLYRYRSPCLIIDLINILKLMHMLRLLTPLVQIVTRTFS